jgi:proline iminopeptidase
MATVPVEPVAGAADHAAQHGAEHAEPLVHHAWQVMHPPRQPWQQDWLDVGDGHALYFEQSGHPGAPAALVLHGGPGACSKPDDRRWFDAQRWRVVLMDQRGCGRARAQALLHANTTAHGVADIEALRLHLGIERWLLLGGSWGSTLALAYAQAHPQRVAALVLHGVFLGSAAEGQALFGTLAETLHAELQAGGARAQAAAHAWWQHEQQGMAHEGPPSRPPAAGALLAAAQIGVHCARAGWFLDAGALLQGATRLQGLPGRIVQGLEDRVTPAAAARALQAAWPGCRLVEVPGAGHAAQHPALAAALVDAVSTFS